MRKGKDTAIKIYHIYARLHTFRKKTNTHKALEIIPRPDPHLFEPWMIGVFLFCLGILAYLRIAYGKRLERMAGGLLRIQILRQIMAEEIVFTQRASTLLFINFVCLFALFLFAVVQFRFPSQPIAFDFTAYVILALVILGVYLLKLIGGFFLRWLFSDKGLIREFLFEAMLIQCALGVILLPTMAIFLFSVGAERTFLLQLCLGLLAFSWIFRIIQGIRLSTAHQVSAVYIILYLCTLEILPVLALLKAAQRALFLS